MSSKPTKRTIENPKDRVAKMRLDLTLAPMLLQAYSALGMTEGDYKYGGYNYRKSNPRFSVYIAALLRHTYKLYNGEWSDPKTRVPHLASMAANLAVIIDAHEQGVLIDDRPPKQSPKFFDEAGEIIAHLSQMFPRQHERVTELEMPTNGQKQKRGRK